MNKVIGKIVLILKKHQMKILIMSLLIFSILNYGCNGQSGKKRPLPNQVPGVIPVKSYIKPVYNIYVENSGSMNGYVQGQAEFKETVGNFLTDIEINNLANSINLNYINSIIIPIGLNIPIFINNLNPTDFINAGGHINTTDISKMLKSILNRTDERSVNIFISDCVFSPGDGVSAPAYLVNQELEIKSNFAAKLSTYDLTTIIMQLSAKFVGSYFDYKNQTTQINSQRPYYIWIIGKHNYIKDLFEKIDRKKFRGGGVRYFYSLNNVPTANNFTILNSTYFDRDKKDPRHKIIKAQKFKNGPHAGEFQISFGIDLKNALIDDDYILNSSNYSIPPNYRIEIKNSTLADFTHILILTTNSLKPQILKIQFKNDFPSWVLQTNSDDDSNIGIGNEMNKTYGIKYLINGVYSAYLAKRIGGSAKPIFEIEISIN